MCNNNAPSVNQVLTSYLWVRQAWLDAHLAWDKDAYGGIDSIRIPSSYVWRPAIIILYNDADDGFGGSVETNVVLRSDGHITWDSPAITKSSCKVDVSYLPFDGQRCRLTFGSWTYNGNQIDLRNRLHTYYIATMTMITASTALTIFIMNVHHCGPGPRPVPPWARWLILHHMARLCCVYEVGESCKSPQRVLGRRVGREDTGGPGESPMEGEVGAEAGGCPRDRCLCHHNDLLRNVGYVAGCFRHHQASQRRTGEWKKVAKVMDRFFMWVFFLMVFLMSVLVLGNAA
ncbi:neuronal acetylcholine receptor subunit alpha-10-like [Chroicocephalus ridibundus]|uniref:neuronal acetylcholine receptor subunit alpha-10-like n=1 Tax=Chroicocephalus ridibundus TaxID=1192867 RepID=UPI002FDD9794